MKTIRTFVALVFATALLGGTATGTAAQEPPIDFDATGGVGFPVGDLDDVADTGPAFAVGFNFGLTERFYLRAQGGAELYDGVDPGDPLGAEGISDLDIDLIHFQAGGLYYLLPREQGRFFATLNGTAGLTNFNVPRLQTSVGTDVVEVDLSELYFSASGGASVGVAVAERVDLFVDGRAHAVFADEDDTAELVQVVDDASDESVDSLGTMWSVPITAGVRFHF